MIFRTNKRFSRIACDCVLPLALAIAGEVAMTDDIGIVDNTPTLLQACEETLQVDLEPFWVILKCSKYVQFSVALPRCGTFAPLYRALEARCMTDYFIQLNGWPISSGARVCDFAIAHNTTFTVQKRLRGGGDEPQPQRFCGVVDGEWIETSKKLDLVVLGASQRFTKVLRKRSRTYHLQALEQQDDVLSSVRKFVDPETMSLVEDLSILCLQMFRSRDTTDRMLAVTSFIKSQTHSSLFFGIASLIKDAVDDIVGPELQAGGDLLDTVTDFRDLLSKWSSIVTSGLSQRFIKLYKFAVAIGVFQLVGIKLSPQTIADCKREAGFSLAGPNFVYSLLDAVSLLLQRGLMFLRTGDWQTFFHGPKSYGEWFDLCQKVKRQNLFLGDLTAVDTNYHSFVADVDRSIEMGEAILKFGEKATGIEAKSIKMLLGEMKLIKANLFTYNEAQKSRRPPFSLLVNSNSSLAKSTFVDMLFKFMGQVWGLEATDPFKYTRNSVDPFWSGWNSSKWFILLDDIAYVNPNSPVQDNSLTEMISLVNDVPLVPNQASLEDKGKNPVRARAVVATTNIKHLNAFAHFACPLAVQRRLPFVISLFPKPEFARVESPNMIDPARLPPITDDWPNFWNIVVERVVDAGGGQAKHEQVKKFAEINAFLDWLREAMTLFDEVQSRAAAGCAAMATFKVCSECNRVTCVCRKVQAARNRLLPKGAVLGEKFTVSETEADITFHESYEPHQGGDCNYMCTQVTIKGGKIIMNRVVPVSVVTTQGTVTPLHERAEYAEVLAEVVRLQARAYRRKAWKWTASVAAAVIEVYSRSKLLRRLADFALDWKPCRWVFVWFVNQFLLSRGTQRDWCVRLGDFAYRAYMTPRWKLVVGGISAACGCILLAKGVSLWNARSEPTESSPEATTQALRAAVDRSVFSRTEKENVWKRDDFEVSSFDKTPTNISYKQLPYDQLTSLVLRNTARIRVSNGVKIREGTAFCVGGHLWVTNNHTVYSGGDLEFTLLFGPTIQGVSPNVKFKVVQDSLFRIPERELVFFEVLATSPKRDLRDLIRRPTLKFRGRGVYLGYDKACNTQRVKIDAVQPREEYVADLDETLQTWSGYASYPTVHGDCGMPLLMYGEPLVAIVGLHMLGNSAGQVWAVEIDCDIVDEASCHFDRPVIQCGTPQLSAPSAPKDIIPLNQRSPLRWLKQGTLTVYGSLTGPISSARSKVRDTLLGKIIREERGWIVDAHAPKLNDWRPWHLAASDIVNQSYGAVDPVKLRACSRSFVEDILSQLPDGALDTIQVLDDGATINGIPGVKFIDKMNFKSSMGEPYRKSKKSFLVGEIGEAEFVQEVKERIQVVLDKYERGERAHPVYCGQTKDEARPWAKVEAGKVRVFTMAPAEWSFVVRKYLLSTVKLIQEHPFVFNASPGCAAQTAEWEQYYDYLTYHGPDRMVAGDYGKFDKKMEASLILEAFRVITELMKAAGWTDEDILPVHCIAEDTAYSLVNFSGDLVEFVGSNPSGHPLTVIVNCIVNVLYMRYCYLELSPVEGSYAAKLSSFSRDVNLLTYGDDNTLGVAPHCDWFNHTAIQRVLATIGVEYTMADKHSASTPFIHIRDVAYLKRKWRWDEDIGAVVCPLEEASIHKMLTVCLPSEEESQEFHMASVMVSAANEFFWHGKATFERERAWLVRLASDHGISRELEIKHLPTWQELYDRYWSASEGIPTRRAQGCVGEHPRDIVA